MTDKKMKFRGGENGKSGKEGKDGGMYGRNGESAGKSEISGKSRFGFAGAEEKFGFGADETAADKESYSAEEVAKLVDKRVKEALEGAVAEWERRLASEKDEAVKLASMSAEERARHEMDKRQKAFDDERSRFMSERMEFEAAKMLGREGLPVTFAKVLAGADADETEENIGEFKKEFLKSVEAALSERLRGKTPRIGAAEQSGGTDPFLQGLLG